jgi:CheY-like chemotaxis protein
VGEERVAELARKIRDDLSSVRDGRIDVRRVELLLEAIESIARSLDGALGTANGGFRSTMLARRRAHEVYLALMRLEDEPASNGAKEEIEFRLAEFRQQCEEIGLPALVQLAGAVRLTVQTLAERPGRARQEAIGHVYQCLGLVTLLEAGNMGAIQPAVSEMNEILRRRFETPEARPPVLLPVPPPAPARKRVLVAANTPLFLEPLLEGLDGADVVRTTSADGLRAQLESRDFDLCLMRDSLPGGLEICQQLSRQSGAPPVVVYSPLSRMEREVSERGLSGFLKVPCRSDEVRAIIAATVDGSL